VEGAQELAVLAREFYSSNLWLVGAAHGSLLLWLQCWSLPGATPLNLLAGFLYG